MRSLKDKVLNEIDAIEYSIDMENHSIEIDRIKISNLSYQIREIEENIIKTGEEKVFLNRILEILNKLKDESDILEVKCRLTDIEIEKDERMLSVINKKLESVGLCNVESLGYGYAEQIQKDLSYRAQLNDKELDYAWKLIREEM